MIAMIRQGGRMFYKNTKLVKRLLESGRRAPAELLEVRHSGPSSGTVNNAVWWDLTLRARVMPDGEEPFEAKFKTRWYALAGGLLEGMVVEVLYDPDDHDKVAIDSEAALQRREAEIAQKQELLRARGIVMTPTGIMRTKGEPTPSDPLAGADRVNDMTARLRAKMAERGLSPELLTGSAPAAAPAPDRLEQLAKLGELHTSGVLSDAEFEAEKQKILGS
jgi:hypothetical protein